MTSYAELENLAQSISDQMNQHYLGVEHLFIALMNCDNSILRQILAQHRLSPNVLVYFIQDYVGIPLDRRYWRETRLTPRYEQVKANAFELSENPAQREFLLAILDEEDSIPIHVLHRLDIQVNQLRETLLSERYHGDPLDTLDLQSDLPLMAYEQSVIRALFYNFDAIEIAGELAGGHSFTKLYKGLAKRAGKQQYYLIKIGQTSDLLNEKRRADQLGRIGVQLETKVSLPVSSADNIEVAGIAYQLPFEDDTYIDLFQYYFAYGAVSTRDVIARLFFDIMPAWWRKDYELREFDNWYEFEGLLPAALVVEYRAVEEAVVAQNVKPLDDWSRDDSIKIGDIIGFSDFTVRALYPQKQVVKLAAGAGSEMVNAVGEVTLKTVPDALMKTLFVGKSIRFITGSVVDTRNSILEQRGHDLKPDFDITQDEVEALSGKLPNLLHLWQRFKHDKFSGYFAYLHGALGLHAVLCTADKTVLADFRQARYGLVLADIAHLEVSLLVNTVAPFIGDTWNEVWFLVDQIDFTIGEFPNWDAGELIAFVRQQALDHCSSDLRDYWRVLAFMCLNVLCSEELSLVSRRLLYVWGCLAFRESLS